MNNVQIKLIFDRLHKASATKDAAIYIEVYHERRRKLINTHIKVFSGQWKNGRIVGRGDAKRLNDKIHQQIGEIESLIDQMDANRIQFSLDALDGINNGYKSVDFLTFLEQRINDRYIAIGTKRQHMKVLHFLRNEYKRIRHFSDLTPASLQRMDEYLHRRNIGSDKEPRLMMQTSIHVYHKVIKHYINDAILQGYMTENPYAHFKVDRGTSSDRVVLTLPEIDLLYNYKTKSVLNRKVRDMFIIQCYTGLSYADMMSIDWNEQEQYGDLTIIRSDRVKTGSRYFVALLPRVKEVLERYNYSIPRLAYDVYNRNLSAVALACGITKHVTTHIGRHTFATTIALASGIPIEVVSQMLGHTNIKTTQIYAKVLPESVLSGFHAIKERVVKSKDG